MTEKKRVNLDVDGFRNAFLGNIQRLQDQLRACYGGLAALTPQAYADATPNYVFVIAPRAVLELDVARDYARQWLARSFFRDVVDQLQAYLDHCCDVALVAAAVTRQTGASKDEADMRRRFAAFKKLGLPAKMKTLARDFELKSDVDAHILSINAVRNCLVHRLGKVRKEDLDDQGRLELRLRRARIHVTDSKGNTAPAEFERYYEGTVGQAVVDDSVRTFALGEHIGFVPEELFDCVHTASVFDSSMSNAFAELAGRFGIRVAPGAIAIKA